MDLKTLSLFATLSILSAAAVPVTATGTERIGYDTDDLNDDGMLTLTIEIPVEGAEPGPGTDSHSASCGNVAPLIRTCTDILGATHAGSLLIRTTVMPGYTGSVTNSGFSGTGSYTWTCDLFAYPLSYYCPPISSSGFFLVGQSIVLQGETTSLSVGTWQVSLENV